MILLPSALFVRKPENATYELISFILSIFVVVNNEKKDLEPARNQAVPNQSFPADPQADPSEGRQVHQHPGAVRSTRQGEGDAGRRGSGVNGGTERKKGK